jgi:7-keto-8-aminopelargonate synthetase-like enzyme
VITEGVFGMRGQQGKLKEICELKSKYKFRLLVDDAHGFGTLVKQEPELVKNRVVRIRLMYTSLLLPNLWLVSEHSLRVIKKLSDT